MGGWEEKHLSLLRKADGLAVEKSAQAASGMAIHPMAC